MMDTIGMFKHYQSLMKYEPEKPSDKYLFKRKTLKKEGEKVEEEDDDFDEGEEDDDEKDEL